MMWNKDVTDSLKPKRVRDGFLHNLRARAQSENLFNHKLKYTKFAIIETRTKFLKMLYSL